jgi:hypothetical protein
MTAATKVVVAALNPQRLKSTHATTAQTLRGRNVVVASSANKDPAEKATFSADRDPAEKATFSADRDPAEKATFSADKGPSQRATLG